MNSRNRKLSWHFWHTEPYNRPSENREVVVQHDQNGKEEYVYALLHNHAIIRRHLQSEVVEVSTAGWPTRTTANAIRACLPAGWLLSCWTLTSPKGHTVSVPNGNNWTRVVDPFEAYKIQNGWYS